MGKPLYYLTIGEASELIRAKKLSPVELTEAYLKRIEHLDGTLKAYVTVTADRAKSDAKKAEAAITAGNYLGPLHGIPIGLKDLYDTEGIPTTANSKLFENRIPHHDGTVVKKLRAAGTVLLGKLSMHEFALGGPPTSFGEISKNPWDITKTPGGSSSGSGTAVAAGLCMAALGSDTGGSIRIPAAYTGIVGFKPTYGRVSRKGVLPLSWSLDHCGPMTWSAEDSSIMLQVIAGHDPQDSTTFPIEVPNYRDVISNSLKGSVIGVPRHYIDEPTVGVDAEVRVSFEKSLKTLENLGARLEEVNVPSLSYASIANSVIMLAEAFSYHQKTLQQQPEKYGQVAHDCFVLGGTYTSADYQIAMRARSHIRREYAEVMRKVDLIATPTMSTAAGDAQYDLLPLLTGPDFMGPMNQTGMPAISVPSGFTMDGLPVGLQLAGKPFEDAKVLNAAHIYQVDADFMDERPSVE